MRKNKILYGISLIIIVSISFTILFNNSYAKNTQYNIKNYSALGDSYASGVGSGTYDPSNPECEKSNNAYSQVFNKEHKKSIEHFNFLACSGAKTEDVKDKQLNTLDKRTDLITLTIGGNDVGFSNIIKSCAFGSDENCNKVTQNAINVVNTQLVTNYINLIDTIKQKAPNARIVLLGYPKLFDISNNNCNDLLFGKDINKRIYINNGSVALNKVAYRIAKKENISYRNMTRYFTGHEVCSTNREWINNSRVSEISAFYHPNQIGQLTYEKALEDTLTHFR